MSAAREQASRARTRTAPAQVSHASGRRSEREAPKPALLVVGHGTRDEAGVAEFGAHIRRLRTRADGTPVSGGFIELSAPPLTDAVAELVQAGNQHLVPVPLVLVAAGHAKGDIPGALTREGERFSGTRFTYGRPLGPHPALLALLEERLSAVLAPEERQDTAVLLVGRGSTDPDANAEVHKVARLFLEGSGAVSRRASRSGRPRGVRSGREASEEANATEKQGFAFCETAFVSLAWPGVPEGLERCRRLGARRVVVVPYFLFPGVLPDRVVAQAEDYGAQHADLEVRCADVIGDCDALADLVLERYTEALQGDIRMNCDTCVYRTAMPNFEHRVGAPQLPHHHPDDPAGHHHHHGNGHAHVH